MIDYKLIYLANVLDGLQWLGIVIIFITSVSMIVFLCFWGLEENPKDFFKIHPHLKKAFLICLTLHFLGTALIIMSPPKGNFAGIMAAKIAAEKNIPLERTVNLKEIILKLINGNRSEN